MPGADFVPFLSNPSDRYPDLALGAKPEPRFPGRAHESLHFRHFSPMNMLQDGYNIRKVQVLLNTRLLTPVHIFPGVPWRQNAR
jgi:hypothetical protein